MPLRQEDVEELEYRDRYIDDDVELIESWADANYPGTYAGYYVNHRAGGTLHIGFTQNQLSRLEDLKAQLSLMAPDRLTTYATAPLASRTSLISAYEVIAAVLDTDSTLRSFVTDLGISKSGNALSIGSTNVASSALEYLSHRGTCGGGRAQSRQWPNARRGPDPQHVGLMHGCVRGDRKPKPKKQWAKDHGGLFTYGWALLFA